MLPVAIQFQEEYWSEKFMMNIDENYSWTREALWGYSS